MDNWREFKLHLEIVGASGITLALLMAWETAASSVKDFWTWYREESWTAIYDVLHGKDFDALINSGAVSASSGVLGRLREMAMYGLVCIASGEASRISASKGGNRAHSVNH